jgi:hypothetical protein
MARMFLRWLQEYIGKNELDKSFGEGMGFLILQRPSGWQSAERDVCIFGKNGIRHEVSLGPSVT